MCHALSKNDLKFNYATRKAVVTKRIVSFLPSATELLFELGAGESVVGVTHECDFPEAAKSKPRVIDSVFDPQCMTSRQIDETVSELAKNNQDLFIVYEDALKKANPDLIIAQGTCAVCSAYTKEVNKALSILEHKPQIEVLDPHSIDDILATVTLIAKRIDKEIQGQRLVESLQKRIDYVKGRTYKNRPKVLCIEWVEPFFTSGHWVPQMVEIAGGTNLVSTPGQNSKRMTLDEVVRADADVIVMMPCGFDTKRTIVECTRSLQNNQRWKDLRAVKNDMLFAVDANSYFSKPSIRTITGIEILAKIIHPDEFSSLEVPPGSFTKIKN
jgi:iron complex transport system substrate-binding protein